MAHVTPGSSTVRAFTAPSGTDDLSSHAHRMLIGALGLALSPVIWVVNVVRPTAALQRPETSIWWPLNSVSAYYYSGAVAVFVGVLVTLAMFLFTYQGYDNLYRARDRGAAMVAGLAALGVAGFPTTPPAVSLRPSWWVDADKWIHYGSAFTLFAALIFFSLFLFPQSRPNDTRTVDKRNRNFLYRACGVVMVLSMVWAVWAIATGGHIFAAETTALWAFAFSWLVKGHADWTAVHVGKRVTDYGVQLVRSLKGLGK